MNLPKTLIIISAIVLFLAMGCGVGTVTPVAIKNDTTEVLRILIDSSFYHQRIPDISHLTRNNPFGDTIIIRFDSILIGHIPANLKCKVLTKDQICSLATEYEHDSTYFCSFLELTSFTRIDSLFYVSLQNTCVMPLFDKNGKARYSKDFYTNRTSHKCFFGLLCGGGISMSFVKHTDSLSAVINGFHSD